MRLVAVGRKNWLFVGSLRAGVRNANMMTLVARAHRNARPLLLLSDTFLSFGSLA
jgi:hypothetical protein